MALVYNAHLFVIVKIKLFLEIWYFEEILNTNQLFFNIVHQHTHYIFHFMFHTHIRMIIMPLIFVGTNFISRNFIGRRI